MLSKARVKLAGFTLTELLVALVINVILFSALITMYIANLNHYHKTLLMNQLNQQLQSSLMMMSSDIRRAGYWANAKSDVGTHQNNNPFMASTTDISTNVSNNCILLTYDHDGDGSLPSISSNIDDERYGFRLSGNTLQARPPGAAFSCTASSSAWENVTDVSRIQITNLSFIISTSTVTTGPGTKGIAIRGVDISITGRLTSDTSISVTLTQHVRIQNDKFIP